MKYKCLLCGYIYDEEKEGRPFSELDSCPVCMAPASMLQPVEEEEAPEVSKEISQEAAQDAGNDRTAQAAAGADHQTEPSRKDLDYPEIYVRKDKDIRYMEEIHQMAVTGKTVSAAMATGFKMPSWDDILIMGAQLDPMPLAEDEPVSTRTVIGKNAKKPLILENPVFVSHMSFGALSREAKIALARGTAMAASAMCSGEGGILPEEMEAADKYIFEYVANKYSVNRENLRNADAIEIKIGQGTKPGMGGHLPGEKVTEEISRIRNKPMGEDVIAPSRFPGIDTKEDMKALVSRLRKESDGRPIGIKIAAGHIERDLAFCVYAQPDFITIDGRGGATGSSPKILRDSTSVPTIYALYRARKYLDSVGSDISLIITGGLRVSGDFAKAIAMGADAIAVATGPLIAMACQQYRICGSGMCPVGVATQDPELRKRLDVDIAARRVANYLNVSLEELKTFARITGHKDLFGLSVDDLATTSREISEFTDIAHL